MNELILETKGGDNLALLKYAIENKYEVLLWYHGVKLRDPKETGYTKQNWRYVQPVALGYSPKVVEGQRKLMLRAWQTRGVSNTVAPGWKTFLVDEIKPGSMVVFDGKDGVYYRPFDIPDGPDYNDQHDLKMAGGKPFLKIDPSQPPGPNLDKKAQPKPEPTQPVQDPTQEPTVTKNKERGKILSKKTQTQKKPADKPVAVQGPKKPIGKPEDQDSIEAQIIPTKKGNPNDPKLQNKTKDQSQPDPKNNKKPQAEPEQDEEV
jgi:hypothetical protein